MSISWIVQRIKCMFGKHMYGRMAWPLRGPIKKVSNEFCFVCHKIKLPIKMPNVERR